MRDVRMRRVEGSRALPQQPPSKTARLIGNIELIEHSEEHAVVASTFHLLESRMRGEQRYFAGTYRHDLVREEEWMIKLKRVDLINSDAAHECLEIFF
jgi:benzoate/toluate 1,2-dioxygenase beta subunit